MPFNFNRKKFATSPQPLMMRDVLRASASLDFPSIAALGNASLTIAVPGAAVGDDVTVHTRAANISNLDVIAYVSATDVVTVTARNPTAGAIDQAAFTYAVIVFKAY